MLRKQYDKALGSSEERQGRKGAVEVKGGWRADQQCPVL